VAPRQGLQVERGQLEAQADGEGLVVGGHGLQRVQDGGVVFLGLAAQLRGGRPALVRARGHGARAHGARAHGARAHGAALGRRARRPGRAARRLHRAA